MKKSLPISCGRCRGNFTSLISKSGCWLHRPVRTFKRTVGRDLGVGSASGVGLGLGVKVGVAIAVAVVVPIAVGGCCIRTLRSALTRSTPIPSLINNIALVGSLAMLQHRWQLITAVRSAAFHFKYNSQSLNQIANYSVGLSDSLPHAEKSVVTRRAADGVTHYYRVS